MVCEYVDVMFIVEVYFKLVYDFYYVKSVFEYVVQFIFSDYEKMFYFECKDNVVWLDEDIGLM